MIDRSANQNKQDARNALQAFAGFDRAGCLNSSAESCQRRQVLDMSVPMTVDYNSNLSESRKFADELQTVLIDYSVSRTYLRNIIHDVSDYMNVSQKEVDFPLIEFRFRVPDEKTENGYYAFISLPVIQRDRYGINTMSINTTFNFAHLKSGNNLTLPEAVVSDELSDLRHFMGVFLQGVKEGLSPELSSAVAFQELNIPKREAFSLAIAHESLNYLVTHGMIDPMASGSVRANQIVEARAKLSESDFKEIARMINQRASSLLGRYNREDDKLEIQSRITDNERVNVTGYWHRSGIESKSFSSEESLSGFNKISSSSGRVLLHGAEERCLKFLQKELNDNGLLDLKIVHEPDSGGYRVVYQSAERNP